MDPHKETKEYIETMKHLKELLDELDKDTQNKKIKKYQIDVSDYQYNKVYEWQKKKEGERTEPRASSMEKEEVQNNPNQHIPNTSNRNDMRRSPHRGMKKTVDTRQPQQMNRTRPPPHTPMYQVPTHKSFRPLDYEYDYNRTPGSYTDPHRRDFHRMDYVGPQGTQLLCGTPRDPQLLLRQQSESNKNFN